MLQTCGPCKFFVPQVFDSENRPSNEGKCHRFPPTAIGHEYPRLRAEDIGCGEYAARASKKVQSEPANKTETKTKSTGDKK